MDSIENWIRLFYAKQNYKNHTRYIYYWDGVHEGGI